MFRVVIPARYASTRLPGKPLQPLAGKPMIQWVYERGRHSKAAEVIIATEDERIVDAARAFGGTAVMTSDDLESGTDRVAEVARISGWADDDIVVNLQGDEPMMPAALIDQVAGVLEALPHAQMATLAVAIRSHEEFINPNLAKVVTDLSGRALYFSRAPIPWNRDEPQNYAVARRHMGIYAYRVAALKRLAVLPPSRLELIEKLEQLRALASGIDIYVAEACEPPGMEVNTPEDRDQVSALLQGKR
jgi:3-deoxy-manno-octulosonate cytidylyltransferase (CMP-KDO synthetase)